MNCPAVIRRTPGLVWLHDATCTCPNDHSNGELDELVAEGVTVHFEAMGQAQFLIGITDPATGRSWSIYCGAVNAQAKGYSRIDED